MTDVQVDGRRRVRPDSVYIAYVLWWTAAGLTGVLSAVTLIELAQRARSDDLSRLLPGAVLAMLLAVLTIRQYNKGRPVARVALTGLAVYYLWVLVIGLSVVISGESDVPVELLIIEITRTVCAVTAALCSFTRTARSYFRSYNTVSTRTKATSVAAVVWLVAVTAIAAQLAIELVDNLPSHGRTWVEWATGRNAISDALQASFLLCLMPAYAAVVRQFEYGRQWARVTLTVLGVLIGTLSVVMVLDALEPGPSNDLTSIFGVLSGVYVVAAAGGIVLSFLPAVNAHVRAAKSRE